MSYSLIIEMNRILGAEWFTAYLTKSVSAEVKEVMKNYDGLVDVVDWNIPFKAGGVYVGQQMSIQDCAYRSRETCTE